MFYGCMYSEIVITSSLIVQYVKIYVRDDDIHHDHIKPASTIAYFQKRYTLVWFWFILYLISKP